MVTVTYHIKKNNFIIHNYGFTKTFQLINYFIVLYISKDFRLYCCESFEILLLQYAVYQTRIMHIIHNIDQC